MWISFFTTTFDCLKLFNSRSPSFNTMNVVTIKKERMDQKEEGECCEMFVLAGKVMYGHGSPLRSSPGSIIEIYYRLLLLHSGWWWWLFEYFFIGRIEFCCVALCMPLLLSNGFHLNVGVLTTNSVHVHALTAVIIQRLGPFHLPRAHWTKQNILISPARWYG